MKNNLYFVMALLDIILGFGNVIAGNVLLGIGLFACAALLAISIKPEEKNEKEREDI